MDLGFNGRGGWSHLQPLKALLSLFYRKILVPRRQDRSACPDAGASVTHACEKRRACRSFPRPPLLSLASPDASASYPRSPLLRPEPPNLSPCGRDLGTGMRTSAPRPHDPKCAANIDRWPQHAPSAGLGSPCPITQRPSHALMTLYLWNMKYLDTTYVWSRWNIWNIHLKHV